MSYENLVNWFVDNLPMSQYESFRDWYIACKNELDNTNVFNNSRFNQLMESAWKNNMGELENQEDNTEFTEHGAIKGTIGEQMEKEETELIADRQFALEQEYIQIQSRQRQIEDIIIKSPIVVMREQPKEPIKEESIKLPPTGKAPEIIQRPQPQQIKQSGFRESIKTFGSKISSGFRRVFRR